MHDLLQLLNSDGADELQLRVGAPPSIVLDGVAHALERPILLEADVERLFGDVANSRQRRELRAKGMVQFLYRFPQTTSFIIRAQLVAAQLEVRVF